MIPSMTNPLDDVVEFDDDLALALARTAEVGEAPRAEVKGQLMARVAEAAVPVPEGFVFSFANEGWQAYPLPGIRMKVLALNRAQDCATILIDAAPGARFPAHHHGGAEECYVVSGDAHARSPIGPWRFLARRRRHRSRRAVFRGWLRGPARRTARRLYSRLRGRFAALNPARRLVAPIQFVRGSVDPHDSARCRRS